MKAISLTDKELSKFIQVLGAYKVKLLWCESKIILTSSQLDYLIEVGKHE